MFHDLLDIALGPSKRGGFNAKLGGVVVNQIAIGGGPEPEHMNPNICCLPSTWSTFTLHSA